MSDAAEPLRRLSDAIKEVKNAAADRQDVVVDLREAHRMRLELLASELESVFADVPADIDIFDFAISSGLQPRLWIDAVSHVSMGRDRRTYRFLRDTRLGRVVLAESTDPKPVADQVTRYVAERVIERQRMMEGGAEPIFESTQEAAIPERRLVRETRPGLGRLALSALGILAAGVLFGLAASVVVYWDRVVAAIFGS